MKAILILCLAALFGGCGHQSIVVPNDAVPSGVTVKQEHQLTDADKIALLRAEAKKRGLQWTIKCTRHYVEDQDEFLADAWKYSDGPEADSTSWRAHDHWIELSPTQADAAYALYQAIQDEPTHPAKTKAEVLREKTPYHCPVRNLSSEAKP